jgi:gamma-glutamylputrescine oxidase
MTRDIAAEIIPGTACFADASDRAMVYGRMVPVDDGTGRLRLTFGGADALMQVQIASAATALEKEMYGIFPALAKHNIKVKKIWGGECDLSRSALPVLCNPSDNMTYVAGFSGQGMVASGVYGEAIAEKIIKGTSEKFNTLMLLSPPSFHKVEIIAKLQAACEMIPKAIQEWFDIRLTSPCARHQNR